VAVHIDRFIELFTTLFLVYVIWLYYRASDKLGKKFYVVKAVLVVYVFTLMWSQYMGVHNALSQTTDNEPYVPVLRALSESTSTPSVVFADDTFSQYVSIMTHDYVLFNSDGICYLASDQEMQDRYLTSRMFSGLTKTQLMQDIRKYAGVGIAVHQANTDNRDTKICLALKYIMPWLQCGSFVSTDSLLGDQYFASMTARYVYIQQHPEEFLSMYHVDFIVIDLQQDAWKIPMLSSFKLIRQNRRFVILERMN
jgi:hypothetical protein